MFLFCNFPRRLVLQPLLLVLLTALALRAQLGPEQNYTAPTLLGQSQEQADAKSAGCISCHTRIDSASMHPANEALRLGCTDCHGGNAAVVVPAGLSQKSTQYEKLKREAHPHPRVFNPDVSANPVRANAKWMQESLEWVRFVNPGDLRAAPQTCGQSGCHVTEVRKVRTSMMTTGPLLWEAALYNNGAYPYKDARFGQSYDPHGQPERVYSWPPPTPEETKNKGVLPFLDPLERWEVSQPGNVLRVFERGGGSREQLGDPNGEQENGRPDVKLSDRGFGTLLRTDPVFLGIQKTRLYDPLLSFPGTNDHPGDYRASGCSGCHVIYANDRDPQHSGGYAKDGNQGFSLQVDPTIPRNESGHPIEHVFTRKIPSSQCMVCHIHPGTNMVAGYFGVTWWDNEVDGAKMYPKQQRDPSQEEYREAHIADPEGSTAKGLWSDMKFLQQVGSPEFNSKLKDTQFADFHGHGWIFRAVFKRDREGNLLDEQGRIISPNDPEKFKKAVQLKDIHLEKGMHCIDCHFTQDAHGNGKLYGATRDAVEIQCADCHGTIEHYATLSTSGPAAPDGGSKLLELRTPWNEQQFFWKNNQLFQRSNLDRNVTWRVVQVKDTITPGNVDYNEKSRLAKTILKDGRTWGSIPADMEQLAHSDKRITCFACHTSWTTSCFGCHLPMVANQRMPMNGYEGTMTRNWTAYNFMVLRDDVSMLGIDGTVTGNKVAPIRSACAIIVSSQNANRDWLYYEQQTVSAPGFSGQAFSPYVPHTVRTKETKNCTDCHVSAKGNNNAWMAQVLIQGTNFLNELGRFAWVAGGKGGLEAVAVAELNEPEAMFGSDLQQVAYPDNYRDFVKNGRKLTEHYSHPGQVYNLQSRGEYLYAAMGEGGLRVFDIANIENKEFSERIITAPVSHFGQKFYVPTKDALYVATPATTALDPTRKQLPENEEQPISLVYGFLYVADKYEGLVIVGDRPGTSSTPGVSTLLDGEPRNNFLHRALAFNPDGKLSGAHYIDVVGDYAYVLCDAGLVVVDIKDPLKPQITATISLNDPRAVQVQFRYAFIVDRDGLKVLDVTELHNPKLVPGAELKIADARNITVSRTYAYISAGAEGIVIANVEQPEHPVLDEIYNAGGELKDTNDVKIGMVSSSQFALVADGKYGMKVIQLFSPDTQPNFFGFSPKPVPKLIARYQTHGDALALSRGVDRDRAVDESGNQLSVFGRRGSRPFNYDEMRRLYLRNGKLFSVSDDPPGPPDDQQARK